MREQGQGGRQVCGDDRAIYCNVQIINLSFLTRCFPSLLSASVIAAILAVYRLIAIDEAKGACTTLR